MIDEKDKGIIRQEIQTTYSERRFQLGGIPRHIHNGLDAPITFQPILNYIGYVYSDGSGLILPVGWSSLRLAQGQYQITHNLGTGEQKDVIYSVITQAVQSTNIVVASIVTPLDNLFTAFWYDTTIGAGPGGATDSSFFFTLTVVNNKSINFPKYKIINN